ncbi:MAG TPA: hypothetical protein VG247_34250 [Pseudonocardiaceae bacterium]|jgi:hypothetical protein|nr:hypothetical protein [Pseudonocardiaceae bacterium]
MRLVGKRGRFLLAAVALSLVTVVSLASSGAAAPHDPGVPGNQTLTLLGKRGAITLPAVPALGIGFMAGGDLYDSTGVTKMGTSYSSCSVVAISVAVPPVITAECTTVFSLAGGELYLGSLRDYLSGGFSNAKVAVLGGTDSYNNVRGDGTVSVTDPTAHSYTFTINLISS